MLRKKPKILFDIYLMKHEKKIDKNKFRKFLGNTKVRRFYFIYYLPLSYHSTSCTISLF